MSFPKAAIVVAHPVHLLTVAGLIQRYRPHVLIWTNSAIEGKAAPELVEKALAFLGLDGLATMLGIEESESYQWAYAGAIAPFARIRDDMLDWLRRVRPDMVFGDAFELSNFQHDVGRAALDAALREYRRQHASVENYEFPLSCRTEDDLSKLRYQVFPHGEHEVFRLNDAELKRKEQAIRWAWSLSNFIAQVAPQFPPIHEEPYRAVPWDRDYTVPPRGLKRHYDDDGRERVRRGALAQCILFEQHFVPIVRGLGVGSSHAHAANSLPPRKQPQRAAVSR
jgi:hypothetical protein